MRTSPRVAHFLCWPELAFSPPNRAIVEILLDLGREVDLFAPAQVDCSAYGPSVRSFEAHYSQRLIARHALSRRWLAYEAFSGTSEDPMALVGILASLYRRKSFTLADEIKTGAFSGDRGPRWKGLCRWAMRRSAFNIVNSREKVPLQRSYIGVEESYPMPIYPGCFHRPPAPGDRLAIRRRMGIPADATVLCFSGQFGMAWGADWLLEALERMRDVHVLGQLLSLDPLVRRLLASLKGSERLHLEDGRVSWDDSWSSMAAADIGMVVYNHPAPQFQNNGLASNRLCMFLAMGVPVVASRQPSFDFLERFECGALAGSPPEFVEALSRVRTRLGEMKRNTQRCVAEYIDAPARYNELKACITSFLGGGRDV